jgi:hypothetical protein
LLEHRHGACVANQNKSRRRSFVANGGIGAATWSISKREIEKGVSDEGALLAWKK